MTASCAKVPPPAEALAGFAPHVAVDVLLLAPAFLVGGADLGEEVARQFGDLVEVLVHPCRSVRAHEISFCAVAATAS
jgi:hypothetical protein